MKRIAQILTLIWLLAVNGYAQNINMSNTPVTVQNGRTVHFFDPGGNNDYPSSSDYTQTFSAANHSQCLQVSFSSFWLEINSTCSYDYLEIYDGSNTNSTLIGKYCGTNSPGTIVSTTGALTFRFHSDGSTNNPGWKADIRCLECGSSPSFIMMSGTPITIQCGEEIQFYDPGGPNGSYSANTDLIQTFTPSEPGQCLQVSFSSFLLETCDARLWDYLEIYDGNSTNSTLIGKYCGTNSPGTIVSTTGALTFRFLSDGSYNYSGWVATIRCVDCNEGEEFTSNEPLCEGDTLVLTCENSTEGASYYWSGPNGWSATTQEPSIEIPNCTTSMSGEYSLYITAAEGTSDTYSIDVNIYAIPEVSLSSTKDTICKGESVTLQASGATSYTWQPTASTQATRTLSPSATTTYIVTGSSNGCSSSDSLTVVVHPKPTITISTDPETAVVCQGDTAILHASGANSYQWRKTTDTTTLSHSDSLCVAPTNNSAYCVIGTNSYGCTGTATKHIEAYPTTSTILYDTACNSYTWHDNSYFESGTYLYQQSNEAGCQSTDTLYLIINRTIETSEEITACHSFTWIDSITYTQSTNEPSVTMSTIDGCDSIIHLHLTIYPIEESTETVNACDSFTWIDGQTYTQSTNEPIFTTTTIHGCDSIVHLHLNLNHSVEIIDSIVACDNYTWIDGQTYTQSTNEPSVTMSTIDGCDSIIHLHLTVYPIEESTETVNACDSFTWIDGQTYYASTTEPSTTLNSIHGCDSIVHLHLNLNHSVEIIDSIVACDNYTWIDGQTYTQSTNEPSVTISTIDGCDSIIHLHLTVFYPQHGSENIIVCEPYTWHGTTYTQSGEYLYEHQDSLGCNQVDTLHLRVTTAPELVLNLIHDASCNLDNGEIKLQTTGGVEPYTYLYMPEGTPAHFDHLAPGSYHLQVIDSIGCADETQFNIENIVHQVNLAATEPAHCGQADGSVSIIATGGFGQFLYQWPAPIVSNTNEAEAVPAGQYTVSVIDSNECRIDLPFSIENEPGPRACFYFTHINDYTMEVVNCTQNVASWHWNFGDGENSDEWQPTHSYTQSGRYEVSLTVTDDFNCENTSSEIYVINEVPTLYLPSAFIPESDIAENRVFKPIGNSIGTEHYEMIIFDRSGGVVFVSHHPDLGWDGKINKKLAPQGTYGYQIKYQTIDGIPASAHGSVILLR